MAEVVISIRDWKSRTIRSPVVRIAAMASSLVRFDILASG